MNTNGERVQQRERADERHAEDERAEQQDQRHLHVADRDVRARSCRRSARSCAPARRSAARACRARARARSPSSQHHHRHREDHADQAGHDVDGRAQLGVVPGDRARADRLARRRRAVRARRSSSELAGARSDQAARCSCALADGLRIGAVDHAAAASRGWPARESARVPRRDDQRDARAGRSAARARSRRSSRPRRRCRRSRSPRSAARESRDCGRCDPGRRPPSGCGARRC